MRHSRRFRLKPHERLSAELRKVGLHDMADRAAEGYYDDFMSPLAAPAMQLAGDLAKAAKAEDDKAKREAIMLLRQRHVVHGEFDG